mmetsp:Transcript_18100/g.21647  ORF Transcript_18100/g.21647 Transcript_18100/m.21647 type:complete len:129 (-) Transcript_18100:114-500(-)
MTTLVPGVMGVVSWMEFPSALVRVAERRREADPGRDVRLVGVTSEGMSHGSCVVGEERKRGVLDDDDDAVVERSFLLTNAFMGGGVNADRVVGIVWKLDADVIAVRAARPAVAQVVNLMMDSRVALPL